MDLGLQNKTALVLGGGGGLGGAIAKALAREGCKVAVADIAIEPAQATVKAIEAQGGTAMAIGWDISDLQIADARVKTIEDAYGPISILVNNTGGPPPTPASGQDAAVWVKQFQAMVLSVITITDRVLPGMRDAGWGRIITSVSSGVVAPIPNLGISNSLRSSLVGWSKTLAREVAGDGITANIVMPGRIATGRVRSLDEQKAKRESKSVDQIAAQSMASIPVGRYGEPDEYADCVAFLASARAGYVTGSIMRVDGGLIASI